MAINPCLAAVMIAATASIPACEQRLEQRRDLRALHVFGTVVPVAANTNVVVFAEKDGIAYKVASFKSDEANPMLFVQPDLGDQIMWITQADSHGGQRQRTTDIFDRVGFHFYRYGDKRDGDKVVVAESDPEKGT